MVCGPGAETLRGKGAERACCEMWESLGGRTDGLRSWRRNSQWKCRMMDVYYVYLLAGAAVLAFKCGSHVFYGTEENQFLVCRSRRLGVLQDRADPLFIRVPAR